MNKVSAYTFQIIAGGLALIALVQCGPGPDTKPVGEEGDLTTSALERQTIQTEAPNGGTDSTASDGGMYLVHRPDEKLMSPEEYEQAMQEFIDQMSDEEKAAIPEDVSMEWWAGLAVRHYQSLEQIGKIEFYGMVVDDEGEPLPDVKIRARVWTYHASMAEWLEARSDSPAKYEDLDIITDSDGRFSVHGMTGIHLSFFGFILDRYWIEEGTKNAFKFVPEGVPSNYGSGKPHEPDPENPVVFVMRRVQD